MGTPISGFATHRVTNQPPPLQGHDVFGSDVALLEALSREGAGWAGDELRELGRLAGHEATLELGRQANANLPVLRTHDRYGHRLDVVDHHPAYHDLMSTPIRPMSTSSSSSGWRRRSSSTGPANVRRNTRRSRSSVLGRWGAERA